MRNYIILNGQNSNSISGLLIQSLAPISKPQMRTQTEEIDGRPGDIVTDLGFSSYDKEITIGLYGNFDINEVIAYFNSQGVVTFSNEPDKFYNYKIYDQIDFERLVRYRTATVTMHCQPFKYSTIEQPDIMSPTDNLLTISNWTKTMNGVTITAKDGTITVTGTPTAATEFYLPINALTLPAGMFTLTATASGQNLNYCSIRMIGSAPSDSDSFGGKYITLVQGTTTLSATLSASKTYNYIWFYMNAGTPLNFTLNLSVEDEAAKVVSDEGTNLVLEGSQLAPFSKLDLKGNTEQTTYTGKNLLEPYIDSTNPITKNGITCTYNADDQTMTFNGTCTADNTRFRFAQSNLEFTANTTRASVHYVSGSVTTYCKARFWTSSYTGVGLDLLGLSASTPVLSGTHTSNYTMSASNAEVRFDNGAVATNLKIKLMVANSNDTTYEPYVGGTSPNPDYPQNVRVVTGENVVKICGKNLLPLRYPYTETKNGVTFTVDSEGITLNGTPSTATDFYLIGAWGNRSISYGHIAAGAYRLTMFDGSHNIPSTAPFGLRVYNRLGANNIGFAYLNNGGSGSNAVNLSADMDITAIYISISYNRTFNNEKFYFQLEKSSSATDFEPYQEQSYPLSLGSLEFCAIGNYVDKPVKIGDKWYKHNAIGKYVYNNDLSQNGLNNAYVAMVTPVLNVEPNLAYDAGCFFSNMFTPTVAGVTGIKGTTSASRIRLQMAVSFADSYDGFKALAAANNLTIYYPLATPTDTEITDEALIAQLDDIYYHAHAYKGRTHVSSLAATGNVPHIIAAAVAQNNDGVVTNSGNYFSKPRLTIYGEGEIGVYLNGIQIFQIALGSEGYITIDTAALEAYKDTTDNLKNRLVTGDYENFALRPGENQLSFSGSVTKCVVENYSRWL